MFDFLSQVQPEERYNELLYAELQEAKEELARTERMFDCADPEFFAIANTDLTIAQLKYNNAIAKCRKAVL